jgi:dihydrolipoamide dehydrogenase
LALDRAGIKVSDFGKLELSENLQTNLAHVFAAGDATAGYQFTHVATQEGYIAGWNAAQV